MSDRPIIFSGPMVRALLASRKTQTRRLASSPHAKCAAGDRFYVRERCRAEERRDGDGVRFAADDGWVKIENSAAAADRWVELNHYRSGGGMPLGQPVPSIHMPRWASRLTLIVDAVRIEPLQAISVGDAMDEGIQQVPSGFWVPDPDEDWHELASPIDAYAALWRHLHGPASWDANPDVLVLTFRVMRGNIDKVAA